MKNNNPSLLLLPGISSLGLLLSACGGVQQGQPAVENEPADSIETQLVQPAQPVSVAPNRQLKEEKSIAGAQRSRIMHKQLSQDMASGLVARSAPAAEMAYYPTPYDQDQYRENYKQFDDNGVLSVAESPVSTFSIDVDTGAYSNVRRFLNQGVMPQRDAVRAEELINYFSYDYAYPEKPQQPFSITTEIAPTPWNGNSHLMHIGLQAYDANAEQRPASNLVFLVDVSGSMHSPDKLALLKSGLKLLVKQLGKDDRISLVTYAGASGVVLKPTAGDQHASITMALENLQAGGGTNGASGIKLAYQMAQQSFIKGGINRILLATDGDFNVGVTNFESLKQMVEEKRKSGISLTTLGFGTGNYNDHLMEQLADVGNGNYSYIDNLNEARKVLVDEMQSTLNSVAHDVKIQVEFNPSQVAEYRLIGYENRALQREDFNNDKVDAGEIGENHSVTALYEVTFRESAYRAVDELRYQPTSEATAAHKHSNELALLKLRYKMANGEASQLITKTIRRDQVINNVKLTSDNFRFSAAVAAFAQQLRGGKYLQQFAYDDILELARQSRGKDHSGYRGEFIQLVSLASSLQP